MSQAHQEGRQPEDSPGPAQRAVNLAWWLRMPLPFLNIDSNQLGIDSMELLS